MVPEMDLGPVSPPTQCSLVGGQARHGAVMGLGTWTVMKETITGARVGGLGKAFQSRSGLDVDLEVRRWCWPKKGLQDSISGEGTG